MTRVAVAGGSGKLGRAVVRDLAGHGYDVVNLDRAAPPADAPGDFVRVDLGDYGQVAQALSRVEDRYDAVDAVVHLAAIPAPGLVPNTTTFVHNITATHHVFAAARAAGIRSIVWASSETVLGLPFDTPPPYLPVDEEYHPRPESSYSLAKTLEEEMARQLCRWDPQLKMVGLRFSNVMYPEDYAEFPSFDADPLSRKWNLWGYIDARDGAQACRRALEADLAGCEVFIIANADTVMSTPSVDLARQVFPDVEVRGEVRGTDTLLSIEKARRVLGYEPEHSWRDEVLPDGGA
jgi:nucleoside-diphosphate-sugar epimerase